MQRYVIETKQIDGGVWLAPWKNGNHTARSKAAALVAMRTANTINACPKRVVDTKTGKVIATIGDDEAWAEYAARCQQIRQDRETKAFNYDAPLNSEFLGAAKPRAGEDY